MAQAALSAVNTTVDEYVFARSNRRGRDHHYDDGYRGRNYRRANRRYRLGPMSSLGQHPGMIPSMRRIAATWLVLSASAVLVAGCGSIDAAKAGARRD